MGDARPAREGAKSSCSGCCKNCKASPEQQRDALIAAAKKVVGCFMSSKFQGQSVHELSALVREIESQQ